jgi:DNA-binding GntR family transcriptional regulator
MELRNSARNPIEDEPVNTARMRTRSIYETLRERICLLDYKPGEIIRERNLAAEFGISRTPLRRALQWLESDGLIQSKPGHGTVVTKIDLQSLKDIYFLRMKLAEIIGASQPLQPGPEVLDTLAELADRCRASMDHPDFRVFGQINIGLHKQFQRVIRSAPLRQCSDRLFYQTARMWAELLSDANWKEELGDLLEEIHSVERCFRLGDVESAGFVHRNHLSMVLKRLNALI